MPNKRSSKVEVMQKKTKEEKIVKQMINAVGTKFFHLLKAKSLGYSMMGAIWYVCVCAKCLFLALVV